eukprot:1210912-Amphidinium_carterae.2
MGSLPLDLSSVRCVHAILNVFDGPQVLQFLVTEVCGTEVYAPAQRESEAGAATQTAKIIGNHRQKQVVPRGLW